MDRCNHKKHNVVIFIIVLVFAILPVIKNIAQDTTSILSALTTEYFQAVDSRQNPYEQIRIIQEILKLDPGSATFWFYLGVQHKLLYEFNTAIDAFEQGISQYVSSSIRPVMQIYDYLGYCHHTLGNYKEEMKVYKRGKIHYPDHPGLIGREAIGFYAQGKIRDANRLLTKYQSYWEKEGQAEAKIKHSMGILFLETDAIKAERYFRSALKHDPENLEFQTSLSRALIFRGVRLEEAMRILEKAIKVEPENPTLLHLIGWGYFRLEEYSLAHDYLVRAEKLYPEYNHNLKLHIDKSEEILSIKLFN